MKHARILALLCALLLLAAAPAWALDVVSYTGDFYVADYADVLSDEVEGHIVLNNDALYEKCGAQIVFVTVDSVKPADMEEYAYTLFNQWGIGSATKHNGILVLMAISDDDYWIMPGKGVQDYITAGDLDELIVTYLEPYFASRDYSGGARALFDQLFDRVSVAYGAGLSVDDGAYFTWLEKGGSAQSGDPSQARFLTEPVREASSAPAAEPEPVASQPEPEPQQLHVQRSEGLSFMEILFLIILGIVVVSIFSGRRRVRRRRSVVAPPPPPPIVPPMHMPRSPRPSRPPHGPFSPSSRPGSSPRPASPRSSSGFGSRPSGGGGASRGGGAGRSSFGGSRPSGGGRSGGGGASRGGGAGRGR